MSPVKVDVYAGYKGEETPRSFIIEGIRHAVTEIMNRWSSDTHGFFRVRTADGGQYVLRYQFDEERWEVVMQKRT
ncbi:MAG TPA: hypothetical protein VFS39_15650 [Nitrospira sp.]|nr:hypothetical protein [Nitrospira sp.]